MPSLNALDILKQDHQAVIKKLAKLSDPALGADSKRRPRLLRDVYVHLKVHRLVEEDIFYPAFKQCGGDEIVYFAAKRQHREVDEFVLPDVIESAGTNETFTKYSRQLLHHVELHVADEENIIFKQAREKLSKQELRALGEQIQLLKRKLEKHYASAADDIDYYRH